MLILIDAYNILKQLDPGAFIQDNAKKSLVTMLSAYKNRKGHSIMLVFDGGHSPWPLQEKQKNVVVVYAGQGKSADDYIKSYIAEHSKQDILLVSSDRELALWANKYGIVSMNALSFYAIAKDSIQSLEKSVARSGVTHKTTETQNPILDALMYDTVPDAFYKQEENNNVRRKFNSEKESKIDRLLRKKVEKL
jgi:predicted RNA-binding protein with PIN domain